MSIHNITSAACNYFLYHFEYEAEYASFDIGNWSVLDIFRVDDPEFGLVASRSLHCAPDLGGRERFIYVETSYGDVVDIRWDNTPDRFFKFFK